MLRTSSASSEASPSGQRFEQPCATRPRCAACRNSAVGGLARRCSRCAVRTLVDPADPDDLAVVNALQDQFQLLASSSEPFSSPDYDQESLNATRQALLELARGLTSFDHAFGTKEAVDPIRHLIGSAAGWGGLPDEEALYENVDPGLPVGEYRLTVRDVPVDAFW